MNISKHITYKEAVFSQTAIQLGIDNTPDTVTLLRMKNLAEAVFEPLREHFNVPLYISSFYRSNALNKAVGGSKTSQHVKGEAMDIDADMYSNITNEDIFKYIKDNLEFDQLIAEFKGDSGPAWIHVSYNQIKNRKQILISTVDAVSKKRIYLTYSESLYKQIYG